MKLGFELIEELRSLNIMLNRAAGYSGEELLSPERAIWLIAEILCADSVSHMVLKTCVDRFYVKSPLRVPMMASLPLSLTEASRISSGVAMPVDVAESHSSKTDIAIKRSMCFDEAARHRFVRRDPSPAR